jgi:glyceraldehyde-3-phosphate dehydrogenase type I
VHGVNSSKFDVQQDKVVCLYGISIAPAIKVIDDHFDVQYGMTNVVNPYTSDMSLHDSNHKDLRRARAAACNIIPTTTGSANAVGAVIPKLQGKLSGTGFRVPTQSVAIQDVVLKVGKPCTREEVNDALRAAAAGPMRGILRVEEQPLVSSDFRQSNHNQTVDAALTMVMGGDLIKIISWYDNEWTFAQHSLRFVSVIAAELKESRQRTSYVVNDSECPAPMPAFIHELNTISS